jgi:hypothetical protein
LKFKYFPGGACPRYEDRRHPSQGLSDCGRRGIHG